VTHEDQFDRAIEEQRNQALRRLEALSAAALGKAFALSAPLGTVDFVVELARMVARDLTAIGFVVHDHSHGAVPGGVWLGPAPDACGVIVTWTQHDASATLFGFPLQNELQRQRNLDLFETLHTLGYPVRAYSAGGAQLVTGFRGAP
jgi:hypothetical protein